MVCAGEHILVLDGKRYAYVVQHNDSLWRIAELCLGRGADWPEIWELNKGRHFPKVGGSLHHPDLIYPGWDIHLPAGAAPPPGAVETAPAEPPQPAQEEPATTAPEPSPSPQIPSTATPAPASPAPAASPSPEASADSVSSPARSQSPPPVDDDAAPDEDGGSTALVPIAFGAALIAATLGAATAVKLRKRAAAGDPRVERRGHQPHHRPQRVDQGSAEQQLQAAAQPLDVDRLDHALRHLAGAFAAGMNPLPDIIGVHVVDGDVHLLLTRPSEPAAPPWRANHTQWTLRGDSDLPVTPDGHLAAVPALVGIGSNESRGTAGGEHLLLDLERLSCLAIEGEPERAYDLLRYIASELAMNSWSDDVEIILAGWSHHEAQLLAALNPERFRTRTSSVAEAIGQVHQRVRIAAAALTEAGAADALAGRVHDLGGDSWMPTVLLAAAPTPGDLEAIADLATDLASIGRSAIAVATVGAVPVRSHRPDGVHHVTVSADGEVDLPFLGTTLAAAGLPADELERLSQVIRTAREGHEEPVPPAPEPEAWADGTDAAGSLLSVETIAGPPEADHGDEPAEQPAASVLAPPALGVRRRSSHGDPTLDEDLAAWHDPVPTRPRIRILGPVTDAQQVIDTPGEPPKPGRLLLLAEVLVYLAQCGSRGASPGRLDDDLWPGQEVKVTYRRATLSRARQWAGRRSDGTPWLAEVHYRLEHGYLLDWHLFRRLRARGQALGAEGRRDLHAALELVRGVPLGGYERIAATTRSPYSWLPTSDIDPEHLVAAIVDAAHELAKLHLAEHDTANARWAIRQAWLADPDRNYDQPWLDLLRAQALDGHQAELTVSVRELMRAREAEVEEDLDPTIYTLLREILPASFGDASRDRLRVGQA